MSLFQDLDYPTVTIAAGQSLSAAVSIGSKSLVGIVMPAAWSTAGLTFQASSDGGATFRELYDDAGNEVTISSASAAASQQIALNPTYWRCVNLLKVRSGTAGTPVTQTPAATLTLVVRGIA